MFFPRWGPVFYCCSVAVCLKTILYPLVIIVCTRRNSVSCIRHHHMCNALDSMLSHQKLAFILYNFVYLHATSQASLPVVQSCRRDHIARTGSWPVYTTPFTVTPAYGSRFLAFYPPCCVCCRPLCHSSTSTFIQPGSLADSTCITSTASRGHRNTKGSRTASSAADCHATAA